MPLCDDLMIENAIYISGDDFYLWTSGKLKPIIGRYGDVSADWSGQTLTMASFPVNSAIEVLARQQ